MVTIVYGIQQLESAISAYVEAFSNSKAGAFVYVLEFGLAALASTSFISSSVNLRLFSFSMAHSNGVMSLQAFGEPCLN